MVMLLDDSNVLIKAEDRSSEQERLRHIVEQPRRHIVDLDHLIRHEGDAAHDEQHRTGVLRDFKTFVFHVYYVLFMIQIITFLTPYKVTKNIRDYQIIA